MDKIQELLTRRVDSVYPNRKSLEIRLRAGDKLRLYQGFDPTGGRLHLGHSIGMRNLQKFAEMGHEVIVLFGTGTVLVGDPSERESGRKLITQAEIDANIQTWKEQVGRIIDLDQVTIKNNGDWLVPLSLRDIIHIASNISAIQLFKRDSFTRRIDNGDTVWFHETFYPLLQGYDSVAMDVDLEIGGTDQMFNMLVGRELQRKINNKEKFVITNPMILGTDGSQMSKSTGNCIWLDDSAIDMYGKTMSIPDEQIIPYMRLLTDIPLQEIDSLPDKPMANKKRLALDIARQFHGTDKAAEAAQYFENTVQNKDIPSQIPELSVDKNSRLLSILEQANFGQSNSDRKRMIQQGGVEVNGEKLTDTQTELRLDQPVTIKYGKRNYVRIKPN